MTHGYPPAGGDATVQATGASHKDDLGEVSVHGYVDVPGTLHTRAFGINAAAEVVGSYISGTEAHGFVAVPKR